MKAPGSLEDLGPVSGIIEVRYPKAHRYWDISGAMVAAIEDELPFLKCKGLERGGFEFLAEPGCGVGSALYGWDKASLISDLSGAADRFESVAANFLRVVIDRLAVTKLQRVGNRFQYLFPTETRESGQALLAQRPVWGFANALSVFGEPTLQGVVLRTTLPGGGRRLRLEVDTGEAEVRGKSHVGVILDVDFSLTECPPPSDLAVADFVAWNRRFLRDNLHRLLR